MQIPSGLANVMLTQFTTPDAGPVARAKRGSTVEPKMITSSVNVSEATLTVGKGAGKSKTAAGGQSQQGKKRQRQWEGKDDSEKAEVRKKLKVAKFNSLHRLVHACNVQTPAEYYGSSLGLWRSLKLGSSLALLGITS